MSTHLSDAIAFALESRDGSLPIFSLVDLSEERVTYPYSVYKHHWVSFLRLVQEALPCGSERESSDHTYTCDVGILSGETFFSSLLEGACLTLGKSFCLWSQETPEMQRRELLEQRCPTVVWDDAKIECLLQSALTTSVEDSLVLEIPKTLDASLAYYIYTSGSTGKPKCIVVSRDNVWSYLDGFCYSKEGLGMVKTASVSLLTLSSPFFDPSIGDLAVSLTSPLCRQYTPRRSLLWSGGWGLCLREVRPTHIVTTPSVLSVVSPSQAVWGAEQPLIKVYCGGEKMSQSLLEGWSTVVELYNLYGVTEATVYQSCERVPPGAQASEVGCGGGTGTARLFLDSSTVPSEMLDLDEGVGEVVVQGPQVCLGYTEVDVGSSKYGVDGQSGERYFYTGDLGVLEAREGGSVSLRLRGRMDWQIKLNGQRVSLEEVDGVISSRLSDIVSSGYCCLVEREGLARCIGCSVVLKGYHGDQVSLEKNQTCFSVAMQHLLALFLATHTIPRCWEFWTSDVYLPRTNTSKVDRRAIAASLQEKKGKTVKDETSDGVVGGGALSKAMRLEWTRYFNVPIHSNSNFFFLGGDSLGALKLTRAVFLRLGGQEEDIDTRGGLPTPFLPSLLLSHPLLKDYLHNLTLSIRSWLETSENWSDASWRRHWTTLVETEESGKHEEHLDEEEEEGGEAYFLSVVASGYVELAEKLLYHSLVPVDGGNTRARRCVTPLHVAVSIKEEQQSVEMVKMLLHYGAKCSVVTNDGVTPVHLAAAHSAPVLSILLQHPKETRSLLCCRDNRQQSVLHFAARVGHTEAVRLLLWDYSVDLTLRDKWQRTAAHWAVLNQHWECLDTMAEYVIHQSTQEEQVAKKKKGETSRRVRLAKRKTHLPYETLLELADRIVGKENVRVHQQCEIICQFLGE